MTIVLDASALVDDLLGVRSSLTDILNETELAAPELIDLEVTHTLRHLVGAGALTAEAGSVWLLRLAGTPELL